jgi:hypothetical protein
MRRRPANCRSISSGYGPSLPQEAWSRINSLGIIEGRLTVDMDFHNTMHLASATGRLSVSPAVLCS